MVDTRRRCWLFTLAACALPSARASAAPATGAADSAWPARPIHIILGLPSGGGADSLARQLSERLQAALGVSVWVESRAGAFGTIAAAAVSRAPPDGYTLLLGSPTSITLAPLAQTDLAYDPARDFAPISLLIRSPLYLIAQPQLAVHTVADLLQWTKLHPGKLNFGTLGPATTGGLATELFRLQTGIDAVDIPYTGSARTMQGFLAGDTDVMFDTGASALPQVRAGKAVILGIATATRSPLAPGVPAIAETVPGFVVDTWNGLLAPAGTPVAIVERIAHECALAFADPQFASRLADAGAEVVGSSPAAFSALLRAESASLQRLQRELGLKLR